MSVVAHNRRLDYPPALVAAVQVALGVKPDGDFGPRSTAALLRWQRGQGMTPDGRLGPRSVEVLLDGAAPQRPYQVEELRATYPGEYWIDVSHHQGRIDWKAAAPFIDGVVIKATEGSTYVDPAFRYNLEGAAAVGLPVDVYHMCLLVWNKRMTDPVSQVRHAARTAPAGCRVYFDLEQTHLRRLPATQERKQWVERLADAVKAEGVNGGLYLSHWGAELIGGRAVGTDLECWWKHYNPHVRSPVRAWPSWMLHQITDNGRCPGVTGAVDINRKNPR